MKIGNRSGDEYRLACISCGSESGLNQVAHRNTQGQITGYVFTCQECKPVVFGSDLNLSTQQGGEKQ